MPDLSAHLRSFATLTVCALVVVLAAIFGWKAMTEPFPEATDAVLCEDTSISKGDTVVPSQVVVRVLNASTREGLAGRTVAALADQGFVAGGTSNAPANAELKFAQIWTTDPKSPAVRLVKSWLPRSHVVKRKIDEPGVVVLVGERFGEVKGGKKQVKSVEDTTICSPPPEPMS